MAKLKLVSKGATSPRQVLAETIARIDGAYAPATIRAYKADFATFIGYCEDHHEIALPAPPELIASFIAQLENTDHSSASIRRAMCGISTIHKLNRYADPTKDPEVNIAMRKMHRKLGRACGQAQGITQELLDQMLAATDNTMRGCRDRALLLVAYDTLCRRSEIVSLQVEDVHIKNKDGVENISILLKRSKTDQDAKGKWLYIGIDAQQALKEWIKRMGVKNGPLFKGVDRGDKITGSLGSGQVGRIYKRLGGLSGLDEELIAKISGHSMRVGAAQDLLVAGASMPMIMKRGRWSKTDTVMRYVEHAVYSVD